VTTSDQLRVGNVQALWINLSGCERWLDIWTAFHALAAVLLPEKCCPSTPRTPSTPPLPLKRPVHQGRLERRPSTDLAEQHHQHSEGTGRSSEAEQGFEEQHGPSPNCVVAMRAHDP
jgi:hypothetical protein